MSQLSTVYFVTVISYKFRSADHDRDHWGLFCTASEQKAKDVLEKAKKHIDSRAFFVGMSSSDFNMENQIEEISTDDSDDFDDPSEDEQPQMKKAKPTKPISDCFYAPFYFIEETDELVFGKCHREMYSKGSLRYIDRFIHGMRDLFQIPNKIAISRIASYLIQKKRVLYVDEMYT